MNDDIDWSKVIMDEWTSQTTIKLIKICKSWFMDIHGMFFSNAFVRSSAELKARNAPVSSSGSAASSLPSTVQGLEFATISKRKKWKRFVMQRKWSQEIIHTGWITRSIKEQQAQVKGRRLNPWSRLQKRQDTGHTEAWERDTRLSQPFCTIQLEDGSRSKSQLAGEKLLPVERALGIPGGISFPVNTCLQVGQKHWCRDPTPAGANHDEEAVFPRAAVGSKVSRYALVSHVAQHTAVTTVVGACAPPA